VFNRRAADPGSKPHAVASPAQENEPLELDQAAERVSHPEKARRRGEALAARLGPVAGGIHGRRWRENGARLWLAQDNLSQDARGRGRIGYLAAGPALHPRAEPIGPGVQRGVRRGALAVEI